jgi:hypothetical protein
MRENLLQAGLEPAELFTGNPTLAADLWAAQPAILGQACAALRGAKRLRCRAKILA